MLHIIKQLESTSSRKEKEEILSSLEGIEESLFKRIAFLTYDPSIDFYVKNFNTKVDQFHSCVNLSQALYDLQTIIASRSLTGNMAKSWIEQQYEMLSKDDAEVFKRVVKRDLKCGISSSTVNKIWPGLVYEKRYMRCSSFSEKNMKNISFPCFSQTKMDGLYVDIIVKDNEVKYRTRNGSYLPLGNPKIDNMLIKTCSNQVLMGEAVALEEDNHLILMDRSKSNGYLNSNRVDPSRIKFFLWDVVKTDEYDAKKSNRPYKDRWSNVESIVKTLDHPQFLAVNNQVCENVSDVVEHFKANRMLGEEGTVVKDYKGKWKTGDSKHQVKVKVIFECEMKLIGWKEGTGKHEGLFGSLLFESSDGLVEVSAGTGYKDEERPMIFAQLDQMIEEGAIATIRANDIVESESKPGKKSLFLPRFVEFRSDKSEADSYERIQEQLDSCLDILKMMEK